MTEQEWLECSDPQPMLEFLKGKITDRKLQLWVCGCIHHIPELSNNESLANAIDNTEYYADNPHEWCPETRLGGSLLSVLDEIEKLIPRRVSEEVGISLLEGDIIWNSWKAKFDRCFAYCQNETTESQHFGAMRALLIGITAATWRIGNRINLMDISDPGIALEIEGRAQSHFLRDISGSPFRPGTIEPSWLTWNNGTVVKIAEAFYADRAFDQLPILADALQDSGCDNPDILAHCRQPGTHVRGCWVVDKLLGKE